MKKTLFGMIFGIITGFIGCIAAIIGLLNWLNNNARDASDSIVLGVKDAVYILFWGTKPNGARRYKVNYVPYNSYSLTFGYVRAVQDRIAHTVINDYDMAIDKKQKIIDTIMSYGYITVAEMYDILEVKDGERYLDTKFGWKDKPSIDLINEFEIKPTRSGYYIDVSCPEKIESKFEEELHA